MITKWNEKLSTCNREHCYRTSLNISCIFVVFVYFLFCFVLFRLFVYVCRLYLNQTQIYNNDNDNGNGNNNNNESKWWCFRWIISEIFFSVVYSLTGWTFVCVWIDSVFIFFFWHSYFLHYDYHFRKKVIIGKTSMKISSDSDLCHMYNMIYTYMFSRFWCCHYYYCLKIVNDDIVDNDNCCCCFAFQKHNYLTTKSNNLIFFAVSFSTNKSFIVWLCSLLKLFMYR